MPRQAKAKGQQAKNSSRAAKVRKIAQPKYKSFRLSQRIKQPKKPLKSAWRLLIASIRALLRNKKLFGGILLIYLLLTLTLVRGFASANLGELKTNLQAFDSGSSNFTNGLSIFGLLVDQGTAVSDDVAGIYQTIVFLIVSLAVIWALRQRLATKPEPKTRIRDAFYKGMYPIVPLLLVMVVILLQLVPLLIANFLYTVVISGGIAATTLEQALWILLFALMALLSLYMVTSSIFAAYIVTLPDVTPMQALRSARELVRFRRWMVMRKLLLLPVAIAVVLALVIIPLIIFITPAAEWVFLLMSLLAVMVGHSFMYHVYRELIAHD